MAPKMAKTKPQRLGVFFSSLPKERESTCQLPTPCVTNCVKYNLLRSMNVKSRTFSL